MGGQAWSGDAFQNLKQTRATQSTQQIFTSKSLHTHMSPKGVAFRESRDSTEHPNSVAVQLFLDVTGSMGRIPEVLVREKFGTLMETLIAHGVPDAHLLFGGIGDHYTDEAPLQVGQFEAGTNELNEWLSKLWLEGNGGGQDKESYSLAWLFGARHTTIDCFEKRKQKGFLFTVGDEGYHPTLELNVLEEIFGYPFNESLESKHLFAEALRTYHVFHLHVNEGSYKNSQTVLAPWKELLNERLIIINDYNTIAEVVATTVAVMLGADLQNVVSGFDDHTAKAVTSALVKVSKDVATQNDGILRL
ncbi:MAG TPA: hypothetical protein VK890_03440 [Bacteroidia bacterium]|jgi:hypothetical protein|nr:hypothetical protein [Bacteroidia bacterium]